MDTELAVLPSASKNEVNRFLDQLWGDLKRRPEVRGRLASQGVDIDAIDTLTSNPYKAEQEEEANSAGFAEAVLIGITVAAGSEAVKKVLNTIWEVAIKPRIEKRFGKLSDS